jgi:hypothetical protein
MTVTPKVSAWVNLIISVLGFVAGAGALLSPIFGSGTTEQIVGVAGLVLGILGAVNAALHGVSAPVPGPLVK